MVVIIIGIERARARPERNYCAYRVGETVTNNHVISYEKRGIFVCSILVYGVMY